MTISSIVVLIGLAGTAIFRGVQARKAWRNPGRSPSPVGGLVLAPFGHNAMRGAGRTIVAQVVILGAAAIVAGVAGIKSPPAAQHWVSAVRGAGIAVGLVGVLAGGLAALLIITVNRPKFLVPPGLRWHDPGGQ